VSAADLRVALVHWTSLPTTGGVESHLFDLASLLAAAGASVTVVTGEPAPEPIAGVELVSVPDLDLRRVRASPDLRHGSAMRHYETVLGNILAERRVTVVHGHNLHHFSPGPALALDRLRHALGFRLFQTFHETWPDVLADDPVYATWDGSFAVSEHVRSECLSRLRFAPELLRLGVDTDRFRPVPTRATPELRVLHPARVLPWKGVHVSVEMLGLLSRRGIACELTITDTQRIADWHRELDAYRHRVIELARSLGVLDRIRFRSPQFEGMPALYADCDVVVYPTVGEEPYGLVPLEAMSCGRPIVASRSGGIVETVVDGETGFLVEPNNPAQLADRVEALAADPELRHRLGTAGRRHVEESFDIRTYVTTIMARYLARAD
jgi:glycosyltransferase involved in cell wall biosynthesis